jgi:hypothetical protein
MALVFQYGSNMNAERLNGEDRLKGDARPLGIASTQDDFQFIFDILSNPKEPRAAADIVPGRGRKIWGVIYEIPDYLIGRKTAAAKNRKSLDAIEGEGTNYERLRIKLNWPDGRPVDKAVLTYVGRARQADIKTNQDYVNHVLTGLASHDFPTDYVNYVRSVITHNNPTLATETPPPARSKQLCEGGTT